MPSCTTDIEDVDVEGVGGCGGTAVGAVHGDWLDEEDASSEDDTRDCLSASNLDRRAVSREQQGYRVPPRGWGRGTLGVG